MKITQVEIENFRCFERLSVTLEPDVTAIVGVNAAGKTALLDAIGLSLLPLLDDLVRRQPDAGTLDRPTFYRRFAGAAISASDIRLGAATPETRTLRISTIASSQESDAEAPLTLRWRQDAGVPDAIGHSTFEQRWLAPEGVGVAPLGLYVPDTGHGSGRHVSFPAFAYYRDTRDAQFLRPTQPSDDTDSERDTGRFMALDAAADYSEAQRWYYVRENLELREARRSGDIHRSDPVLDAVRSAIRGMLDGIDEIYADDDPPRIKARQRRDDGQPITLDFRQLSAGQRNLMAITIDFARRLALNWPGWDAPLEAPGILLIDEIELNLHPAWQQTVIAHLRRVFPDTQVIVATHSPQVLTTLRREQIRVLGQTRQGSAVASAPLAPAYGELSSDVLLGIMGVDPVPPIPEREELRTLSALVDQGAYDTPDARKLLAQLREQLRADHPQLRRLERSIGRQRALKR